MTNTTFQINPVTGLQDVILDPASIVIPDGIPAPRDASGGALPSVTPGTPDRRVISVAGTLPTVGPVVPNGALIYDGSTWTYIAPVVTGVQGVTGNIVDNTDPANPVVDGVQGITGNIVDNTDPANPIVTQFDYIPTTLLGLQGLIATADLLPGMQYLITDIADMGMMIMATSTTTIASVGSAGYLNADWQNVGDYSGVQALTTIPPTSNLGMWRTHTISLEYDPTVRLYINNLTSPDFNVGDTLGNTLGAIAEIISIDNTITLVVSDTTGINPSDSISILDSGLVTLQAGTVVSVVDETTITVGSLTGGWFDAYTGYSTFGTGSVSGDIFDIQYGLFTKIIAGDWANSTTVANQITGATGNIYLNSYLTTLTLGEVVFDTIYGANGIIVSNTGTGTTTGTLVLSSVIGVVPFGTGDLCDDVTHTKLFYVSMTVQPLEVFNPMTGDIVIWRTNGNSSTGRRQHRQKITGAQTETLAPDLDPTNWTLLPIGETYGHIPVRDEVGYDLVNTQITFRNDVRLKNYVGQTSLYEMDNFQRGNTSRYSNDITDYFSNYITGAGFVFSGNRGPSASLIISGYNCGIYCNTFGHDFSAVIAGDNSYIANSTIERGVQILLNGNSDSISKSNIGIMRAINLYAPGSSITGCNTGAYGIINDHSLTSTIYYSSISNNVGLNLNGHTMNTCEIALTQPLNIILQADHSFQQMNGGYSNFKADLDAAANYAAGVLTLPADYNYIGIINFTTSASGPISNIQGDAPIGHPFEFTSNDFQAQNTILPVSINSLALVAGAIVSDGGAVIIRGRVNGSDFYQVQKSGDYFMKRNVVALV